MTSHIKTIVDERLEPWAEVIGPDREAYSNHVTRVLAFCDALHGDTAGSRPSEQEEFITAAVFHDIGIWTAGTIDYLAPSENLASEWLTANDHAGLVDIVTRMISEHHKIRAAGSADDAVEIFRRADTIDASLGMVRFGLSKDAVRQITREHPNAGFHKRLVQLAGRRLLTNPLHPMPMMKW